MSKRTNDLQRQIESLGRPAMVLDADAVLRLLRVVIELEGGQSAFAARRALNRSNINAILNGKRPVSGPVAKALGLRKVYIAAQNGE